MRPHGADQHGRAGIEPHALVVGLLQGGQAQTLQLADPFAQGALELDLAAHGPLGDGGDLRLQPGEIGQLVQALAADDGRIHVGHEQGLAPALARLDAEIHRQPGQGRVGLGAQSRHITFDSEVGCQRREPFRRRIDPGGGGARCVFIDADEGECQHGRLLSGRSGKRKC